MATPTYDLLGSVVLSADTTTVEFVSIDQSFRDLVLVADWTRNPTSTFESLALRVNDDSSTSVFFQSLKTYGGTISAGYGNRTRFRSADSSTTAKQLTVWNFMDYSTTDRHKSVLINTSTPGDDHKQIFVQRWPQNSAITKMTITCSTFATGSTFSLYGIAA